MATTDEIQNKPSRRFAIEAKGLSKSFDKTAAIKDISFTVNEGELFGIIGADGAGKTTLFRILTTVMLSDAGTALVNGNDVAKDYKKIRQEIGYMPGRFSLYQDLTVEENLNFYATIFGTTIEQNYDLIKDIYSHIEPFKKRRAGKLSGGMKQKLALSCALINKPKILFLDEPTTGVDPVSRKEFWDMLKKLNAKGITILVSTPYMDEANLCDRIALIQDGGIMEIDTPGNITAGFKKPLLSIISDNKFLLINQLREYEFAYSVYPFGDSIHYTDKRENINGQEIEAIHTYLAAKQLNNIEIKPIKPGIEDCFIYLMQTNGND